MKKIAVIVLLFTVGLLSWLIKKPVRPIEAQSNTVDIIIDSDTYGTVAQSIGVAVEPGITTQSAQDIISAFDSLPLYIKLTDPTASVIQSEPIQILKNAGYRLYESFSQNSRAISTLDSNYPLDRIVVELPQEDAAFISSLKQSYPGVKVHVGNLQGWQRSRVNEIIGAVQPPILDAVSFTLLDINEGSVWKDVKFAFDTLFDASETIGGEAINFPANSAISVSNAVFPPYASPQKTAYLSGIVSGTIITSVQSQGQGGEAPIRFVIPGQFSSFNSGERVLLRHFAQFMSLSPTIVWPMAIHNNGDIWDNGIYDRSNTEPIVGVIGAVSSGFYGFLTNTSANSVTARVSDRVNFSAHKAYSIVNNAEVTPSNGNITINGYDTIVIYPSSLPAVIPPTGGNPTATLPPGVPTATLAPGVPTSTPTAGVSCDTLKLQGNFDCTGVVDESDFTSWKESYTVTSSGLAFFEYWRRAMFH